jgi:hypothetical protein
MFLININFICDYAITGRYNPSAHNLICNRKNIKKFFQYKKEIDRLNTKHIKHKK